MAYDDKLAYGIDNAVQSLENVKTYMSWITNSPEYNGERRYKFMDVLECVENKVDESIEMLNGLYDMR